jgi:hypothetical protein
VFDATKNDSQTENILSLNYFRVWASSSFQIVGFIKPLPEASKPLLELVGPLSKFIGPSSEFARSRWLFFTVAHFPYKPNTKKYFKRFR